MLQLLYFSACILPTVIALPIVVASKKDSNFCCQCTVDGDGSGSESIPSLGLTDINTINVLTRSLTSCEGLLTNTVMKNIGGSLSNTAGGLVSTNVGGFLTQSAAGLVVPSVQIYVPQMQFPAAMNILPQQQQLLYNLQPMQSSFFSLQQPKISTQCCVPCPDGNGICCCTPGAATTSVPHDFHTLYPPYHPAGAQSVAGSTLLLASTLTVLVLMDIL
uniref:Uncharacterized protein n=1 Tax=Setaria digitata TaxID=48799 RepID=A0A915PWG3_9BILA